MKPLAPTAALLFAAACSPAPTRDDAPASTPTPATPAPARPGPTPASAPTPSTPANVLTLEGLGALHIGRPVPAGSDWAERGAQIPDTPCRTISSPRHPGVYAIVEDGIVRRISIGQRSDVTLVEGIGPGATERAVRAAFPGFRETPHEYIAAPGKNLTAPNAGSGDVALRFEIDAEGRVSTVHVGTMPVLAYSEGCA